MNKLKVLFICVHNSARSQMAEAFLENIAGGKFEVESAGLEPGSLNPLVVEVMKEIGIDISFKKTKSVFDLYKKNKTYDYVITVCDESNSEKCPIFPGNTKKLNWSFGDPSSFKGPWEDKLKKTREIRNNIKQKLEEWVNRI